MQTRIIILLTLFITSYGSSNPIRPIWSIGDQCDEYGAFVELDSEDYLNTQLHDFSFLSIATDIVQTTTKDSRKKRLLHLAASTQQKKPKKTSCYVGKLRNRQPPQVLRTISKSYSTSYL
ncbi:MAG: hypothetical protein AB8C84_04650 [Oligoflexales bacterium]